MIWLSNAGAILGVPVDDTARADQYVLVYDAASGTIRYAAASGAAASGDAGAVQLSDGTGGLAAPTGGQLQWYADPGYLWATRLRTGVIRLDSVPGDAAGDLWYQDGQFQCIDGGGADYLATGAELSAGLAGKAALDELAPSSLPSLWGFWDAAAEVGYSDGDPLATILDQSGNGRDLTTTNSPTFETAIFGSRPAYRFARASAQLAQLTTGALAQPITILGLAIQRSTNGTLWDASDVANQHRLYRNSPYTLATAGATPPSLGAAIDQPMLVACSYSSTASMLWLNRMHCPGNVGAVTGTGISFGGSPNYSDFADIDFGWTAVCSSLLTPGQIQGVWNWTRRVWGI